MVEEVTDAKTGGATQIDQGHTPPVVLAVEDRLLQAPHQDREVWMDADLGDALLLNGTPFRYSKGF